MNIHEILHRFQDGAPVIIAETGTESGGRVLVMAASLYADADALLFRKMSRGPLQVAVHEQFGRTFGFMPPYEAGNDFVKQSSITVTLRKTGVDEMDDSDAAGVTEAGREVETVHALSDAGLSVDDFQQPGLVKVNLAKRGGLLKRVGFAEAASDLARLAGLPPVAVFTEMSDESDPLPESFPVLPIDELIGLRREKESHIQEAAVAKMPTEYGTV